MKTSNVRLLLILSINGLMRTFTVIQTTIDDESIMDSLIKGLLDEKLVACAQVNKIQSSYWWNGKIERTDEFSILFKLPFENKNHVIEFIEKNHSYDVPEINITETKTTER